MELLATRGSALAQKQAQEVQALLTEKNIFTQLHIVKTQGDNDLRPFAQIPGAGFFTKEIEYVLLRKEAQWAVHSCKDLSSMTHKNLPWVAVGERHTEKDVLLRHRHSTRSIQSIGTSSPRRTAQIKRKFPQSHIQPLRGNLDTRIKSFNKRKKTT